jgi:ABC-type glycerol-3-phosphate transport system permease component
MSPVGQLSSAIFFSARELHTSFHPLLAETSFAAGLERPVIIAITASLAVVLLSLGAAYALPRSRSVQRPDGLFVPLMFAAMFVLLPLSLISVRSNVVAPTAGIIIIYMLAVLPFCIWHLRNSLNRVRPEVEDAARIDGCSTGQVFRHVVLPVIAPSLVVTAVCSLMAAWSFCLIVPSILQIPGSAVLSGQSSEFDPAAVCIAAAPLVVLFLFLSVYLVRKARAGAQTGTPS